jgi:alkylated DNA repair dioxygenase AlkB
VSDQFQFELPETPRNLLPHDGEATYHGPVFAQKQADTLLASLLQTVPWEHDEVFMFGKKIVTARQVAWFGDQNCHYTYSGKTHHALPWTRELLLIKELVESLARTSFNSCLANLYHEGEQGMGWHQDNEKELGPQPTIASVSFGAQRRFDFRHKVSREKVSVNLEHGSLLIMADSTQTHWQHQLPKTKKVSTPRVNLTFRTIHPPSSAHHLADCQIGVNCRE